MTDRTGRFRQIDLSPPANRSALAIFRVRFAPTILPFRPPLQPPES